MQRMWQELTTTKQRCGSDAIKGAEMGYAKSIAMSTVVAFYFQASTPVQQSKPLLKIGRHV
jgi:hypothetical protein